jgi:fermentation-respiration switch protein FrsA (DUF1100 family)
MSVRAVFPAIAGLATLFAVAVALFWTFQRSLIYFPGRNLLYSREEALPAARDVSFAAHDGTRLAGWLLEGPQRPGPRTIVLVCNGNAGDRSLRGSLADAIATSGASVLLFDYRGYGGNAGSPSEAGLVADALAARRFLDELPEYRGARIVYFGESIGSGVALGLAAKRPPDAIILRSPFPSLVDVGRLHYPFLPVRLMLRDRYESKGIASALRCPALVIAGGADRVIPESLSREVFDALPGPKRLLVVPGADHNDAALIHGTEVVAAISTFLGGQLP